MAGFGFARRVLGGAAADAAANAAGAGPDSALMTLLGPLTALRNAAALAQGVQTPDPLTPTSDGLQHFAEALAPQPDAERERLARAVLGAMIPTPGPAREATGARALERVSQVARPSLRDLAMQALSGMQSLGVNAMRSPGAQ